MTEEPQQLREGKKKSLSNELGNKEAQALSLTNARSLARASLRIKTAAWEYA